jgi:pimeloyl-ACP methyl ester carboxylesterase
MQQKSFSAPGPQSPHRIAYTEWGQPSLRPPVICVHGLVRNARDFDRLAAALERDDRQVFCPDMPGRGQSEWLSDPALYTNAQYAEDMKAFIASLGITSVDWVGTSMGGLVGMLLAAQPDTPIRRLVINDIGPFIPLSSLKRIAGYVGIMPEFADLAAAERHLRQLYAPFGITEDEDWHDMAEHSVRKLPNGKWTLNYDPAIAQGFNAIDRDVDLWEIYDRISCPTLVLRGMQSDILASTTALEMTERGPKPNLVEFPKVGHAPALMETTQIMLIEGFLRP